MFYFSDQHYDVSFQRLHFNDDNVLQDEKPYDLKMKI